MIPTVQIFDKTVSAYVIFVILGILSVLFVTYRVAKKHGLDEIQMLFMTLIAFGASGVGGGLLYGLLNYRLVIALVRNFDKISSFGELIEVLKVIFGGSVFYGGLLGILLAVLIYTRKKHLSARYLDIVAIGVPLFHTFGRVGCFLGGCCYGVECSFGFVYHYSPIPYANGVRRFPVQLLEAGFNLCLCLTLYLLFRKEKYKGHLLSVYLFAYPTFRFLDEFLRGDVHRGIWWGLSTSQWISLLLIAGNALWLLCSRLRKQRSSLKATAEGNNE